MQCRFVSVNIQCVYISSFLYRTYIFFFQEIAYSFPQKLNIIFWIVILQVSRESAECTLECIRIHNIIQYELVFESWYTNEMNQYYFWWILIHMVNIQYLFMLVNMQWMISFQKSTNIHQSNIFDWWFWFFFESHVSGVERVCEQCAWEFAWKCTWINIRYLLFFFFWWGILIS